jgi:D-sedoheptulose 7-phosphate isomerase
MESWTEYLATTIRALENVAVADGQGHPLSTAAGFDRWIDMAHEVGAAGRCLYFIGNGASAMMAGHMATDFTKNCRIRAWAFNDAALLTATGNDAAFDQVFALPLERHARPGDLVISISSSGESPNIVRALETARDLSVRSVTLSGKRPDNRSRSLGDLNFYVPAQRYGWVETAHQLILHYWLDQYLNRYGQGAM